MTHDQTYSMKISSVQHDSEVSADVVNVVGTKMDPRQAAHTEYVEELKSPLKAWSNSQEEFAHVNQLNGDNLRNYVHEANSQ